MEHLNTKQTALAIFDLGLSPVVISPNDKKPVDLGWPDKQFNREELAGRFDAVPDSNIGIRLGAVIDVECDSETAEAECAELFKDCPMPVTPSWQSRRGPPHKLFARDERLYATGKAVLKYKSVEIRLGAGKGAQSLLPPSVTDGFERKWITPLSAECLPAKLPDLVVDRILSWQKAAESPAPAVIEEDKAVDTPGDDYNRRARWSDILLPHGWTYEGDHNGVSHWKRPGKTEEGLSATTGHCKSGKGDEKFYVFSSAAEPFDAEKSYSKFAVYTILNHAGDFSEATKALAKLGYGGPSLWGAEGRTDAANARRFALKHGDVIRWCDHWGKWLVWDGKRWQIDNARLIEGKAKKYAHSLWAEIGKIIALGTTDEIRKALTGYGKASNSNSGIHHFIALTRSEADVAVVPEQLDLHPFLLNVNNGTVDLRTGELIGHDRKLFITKLAPVDFNPNAKCPLFESFLDVIFAGNGNLIGFIQRLCGYCLTGDVSEQVLPIFYGTGQNGKSTLLTTLQLIMGDYASNAAPELLTARKSSAHPTELSDLHGRRCVIAAETEHGANFAEAKIKQLTGGDRIKGRRMREDFWEFDPTHKLIVSTNHRPSVRGDDFAIWRRLLSVPFDVTIPPGKRDRHFGLKLKAELPGILQWLIRGCLEWQRRGLAVPEEVISATEAYKKEEDSSARFLAECCVIDAKQRAPASELLSAYRNYTGERTSAKKLANLLREKGFANQQITAGGNRGRIEWLGIGLIQGELPTMVEPMAQGM